MDIPIDFCSTKVATHVTKFVRSLLNGPNLDPCMTRFRLHFFSWSARHYVLPFTINRSSPVFKFITSPQALETVMNSTSLGHKVCLSGLLYYMRLNVI